MRGEYKFRIFRSTIVSEGEGTRSERGNREGGVKLSMPLDNSAAKSSLHIERCGLATRSMYFVSDWRRAYPYPPFLPHPPPAHTAARNLQKFLSLHPSVRKVNIVGRKLAMWHTRRSFSVQARIPVGISDTRALHKIVRARKNLDERERAHGKFSTFYAPCVFPSRVVVFRICVYGCLYVPSESLNARSRVAPIG